jgi:hypothetical protein
MAEADFLACVRALASDRELAPVAGLVWGSRQRPDVAPGLLALLTIAALTDTVPARGGEWRPAIRAHWSASRLQRDATYWTSGRCPITNEALLGKSLRAMFARLVIARRVIRVECCPTLGVWRVVYREAPTGRPAIALWSCGPLSPATLETMDATAVRALPGLMIEHVAEALADDHASGEGGN